MDDWKAHQRDAIRENGKRDPWIAIMVADQEGRGVRLSPEEVRSLARDNAIYTSAMNALEDIG